MGAIYAIAHSRPEFWSKSSAEEEPLQCSSGTPNCCDHWPRHWYLVARQDAENAKEGWTNMGIVQEPNQPHGSHLSR